MTVPDVRSEEGEDELTRSFISCTKMKKSRNSRDVLFPSLCQGRMYGERGKRLRSS
jgi:hypothetical protein